MASEVNIKHMSTILNGIHYYEKESDAKEGFAVIPTGKGGSGIVIVIHGIGEIGDGSLNQLQNIMEGWDNDGDGPLPRQWAMPIPAYKKNLKDFNFLGVHVNYKSSFTSSDFIYVIDTVVADFKANRSRVGAICFSLGGNQLIPFITSSVENAKKLVLAVLCAPVNPGGNWQNVVDAKLQVIGTTYAVDKRVSADNVRRVISDINRLNPTIKPVYKEWPGENHGTLNEMMADPAIFQYMNSVSTSDRKQYATGGTSIPTDPGPVQPGGDLKAVATVTGTGPTYSLSGRDSTGYRYQTWTVKKVPDGQSLYAPYINGVGNIVASFKAPVKGLYEIEFKVFDSTDAKTAKTDTVTLQINYGDVTEPIPKTFKGFDSGTRLITWSDGSTEPGKAVYANGAWTVKDAAGEPIAI